MELILQSYIHKSNKTKRYSLFLFSKAHTAFAIRMSENM